MLVYKGGEMKVPEGGLHAALDGLGIEIVEARREYVEAALEEFIKWQSDRPPVLTDEMWHQLSWDGKATTVTRENMEGFLRFVFRRMYVVSEKER